MIEGLVSLVIAIVETLISLFLVMVEFVAGFFVAAGETLTVIDLIAVLVVAIFECLLWFALWVIELIVSLFKWRKPHSIKKPILWRPKIKLKKKKQDHKTDTYKTDVEQGKAVWQEIAMENGSISLIGKVWNLYSIIQP